MKNKMILYLSHSDITLDSRILKSMKVAHDAGYIVSGIGIRDRGGRINRSRSNNYAIKSIQLTSRKFVFFPNKIRHFCSLIEFYIKILLAVIPQKADIVHCNDTIALPIGVLIKLIKRAFIVYDAHELESNKNGQSRISGVITLFIERKLWRFVDALLVVSLSIKRWYIQNVGRKKTTVILNSPVIQENSVSNVKYPYLRNKFKIPEDKKIFIYIGMLMPGRGLDLVLDAFIKYKPNAALVFLGGGDMLDALKAKGKSEKSIFFHEPVPHDRVIDIAKSANFGLCLIENVSLSDYYCLPNKFFEYVFARIPVLASDFPDLSYLLHKHNLGLCADLDVDSIGKAIVNISNDKLHFSINTEELMEYGWAEQANKLHRLYSQLLLN